MSSAEADTPENQPTLSGDASSRSRNGASPNASNSIRTHQPVESTIVRIEDELEQIDRIIHSWSDGRTLRFDPAHVKPPKENADEKAVKEKLTGQNSNSFFASLFSLNLIAMLLVLGASICEFGFGLLGTDVCIGILAGTSIAAAMFNLFLVKQLQKIQPARK